MEYLFLLSLLVSSKSAPFKGCGNDNQENKQYKNSSDCVIAAMAVPKASTKPLTAIPPLYQVKKILCWIISNHQNSLYQRMQQ